MSLRQQLRRQAAAYSDNLAEVLRVQATELENRLVLRERASSAHIMSSVLSVHLSSFILKWAG